MTERRRQAVSLKNLSIFSGSGAVSWKVDWEIENINQPFWMGRMFISKSFCSNPGVDAQIIQISLTFHSSLLHSFEFKTLQVNAPVGRVLLLLRAVQSKCNKKQGAWPSHIRADISSHFTTCSRSPDVGEEDASCAVCLTVYLEKYVWYSDVMAVIILLILTSPAFHFSEFNLRRAVHHGITRKSGQDEFNLRRVVHHCITRKSRWRFFFYFWQHKKVVNVL